MGHKHLQSNQNPWYIVLPNDRTVIFNQMVASHKCSTGSSTIVGLRPNLPNVPRCPKKLHHLRHFAIGISYVNAPQKQCNRCFLDDTYTAPCWPWGKLTM
jgi:hypothetical protein